MLKSLQPLLLIASGGALGSLARYGLSGLVQGNRTDFPLGTLVVNLLGCLVMGMLGYFFVEYPIATAGIRQFLALGFLGAFTTFSTFSFETLNLLRAGVLLAALGNIAFSLFGCLAAVTVGFLLARAIWS